MVFDRNVVLVFEPMDKRCAADSPPQTSVQALDNVIQRLSQCPDPGPLRQYNAILLHNAWQSSLTLTEDFRAQLQEKLHEMQFEACDLPTASKPIIGNGRSIGAANEDAAAQLLRRPGMAELSSDLKEAASQKKRQKRETYA